MNEDTTTTLLQAENDNSKTNCVERTFSFQKLVYLFFCINLLNYAERVVIGGSSVKILEFIRQSIHGNEHTYYGALTSAFIVGFSIASVIFGYYVTRYAPFRVVCVGLICWLCAAIGSGLAPNYWVLLVSRLISGVGEAAFQIVIPSYINDHASKDQLGSAMAWLYAAISVGTAIGFMGSGYISTYLSWRVSFLAVAPLMIPAIIILYYIKYNQSTEKGEERKSFFQATFELIKAPVFIFAFLGEAFNVFICAAYTAFGNQFLIHFGVFQDEATSSLVFGAICVVAGILGSIIGGATLNCMKVDDNWSTNHKLYVYSIHFGVCCFGAMVFFIFTAFTLNYKILFFTFFFLGFTCIFASNPTWTLVILNTASPFVRPMALGVATIFYHLCGDVPAPMVVGRVLDYFLKVAGSDEHKQYFAYLYSHWFSLAQSIIMVVWCLLTILCAKLRYKRELAEQPKEHAVESSVVV